MTDVIYNTKVNLNKFTLGLPFNINTISIILFCAMYSPFTLMLLLGLIAIQVIYFFYKLCNSSDRVIKYFCKKPDQAEFSGEHSFLILGFLTFFLTMVQKSIVNNSSFGLTFIVMFIVSILFLFITVDQKENINNQRVLIMIILLALWALGSMLGAYYGSLAGSLYKDQQNCQEDKKSSQDSNNITCDQDDLETNYICQEYTSDHAFSST